ncbi:MAG: ferredoxin family protein [Sedimentisphaerales bacterium]|nr:ferredoxin family protein [Sedimentisphaerales bacterium]
MMSRVIFCQCKKAAIISDDVREELTQWFHRSQIACEVVEDLCGLAAHKDERLVQWAQQDELIVVACYERAVRWLFSAAGAQLKNDVRVLNQRVQGAQEIVAGLEEMNLPTGQQTTSAAGEWVPWFPVIDYSRCINCRQCYNFCLFGVFAVDAEGKVQVAQPANCKTGCPACARVCPAVAIIFAKYNETPFNGDVVDEQKLAQLRQSKDFKNMSPAMLQRLIRARMGQRGNVNLPNTRHD